MKAWGPSARARAYALFCALLATYFAIGAFATGIPPDTVSVACALVLGTSALKFWRVGVRADDGAIAVHGLSGRGRAAWVDVTSIEPIERGRFCAIVRVSHGSPIRIEKLAVDGALNKWPFRRSGCRHRDEMLAELETLRRAARFAEERSI
jgi:hypothetical protein